MVAYDKINILESSISQKTQYYNVIETLDSLFNARIYLLFHILEPFLSKDIAHDCSTLQ